MPPTLKDKKKKKSKDKDKDKEKKSTLLSFEEEGLLDVPH